MKHAFLDFTQDWNVKRIAYAASFGSTEWEYSEQNSKICAELVKRFNAVSVREVSGIQLCRDFLALFVRNGDIFLVLL